MNFSSLTFGDENKKEPQKQPDKLVSLNGHSFDLKGDHAKFIGETFSELNRLLNNSFLEHLEEKRETGLLGDNQNKGPVVFADD